MRVIVVSSESLFLDGLVALIGEKAEVISGTSIRQSVRSAIMEPGSALVVDDRSMTEGDVDYLVGAREFGSFDVYVISDEDFKNEDLGVHISRQSRGADLLAAIADKGKLRTMKPARNGVRTTDPEGTEDKRASRTLPARRGRPRESTNSLPLAPRQYELARLIAEGHSNKSIAEKMNLREQTVKNMVRSVVERLQCESRNDIAALLVAER